MFITKRRLNAMLTKAADDVRAEMLVNERFNEVYRYLDEERKRFDQELAEINHRIEDLEARANKKKKN